MAMNRLDFLQGGYARYSLTLLLLPSIWLWRVGPVYSADVVFNEPVSVDPRLVSGIAVADVNNDGYTDIAVGTRSPFVTAKIDWYENRGGDIPTFSIHEMFFYDPNTIISYVFGVDFDRDMDIDLVFGSRGLVSGSNAVEWFENNGAKPPDFARHVVSLNLPVTAMAITDLDHDQRMDILAGSYTYDASINPVNNTIAWFRNNGSSPPQFTSSTLATQQLGISAIIAEDLDRDGDQDFVASSFQDHKIVWYVNNGASLPAFTERLISSTKGGTSQVHGADLDGDGDLDLIAGSVQDQPATWFENNGARPPGFTERTFDPSIPAFHKLTTADLNADGKQDIVCVRNTADIAYYYWLENTGGKPARFVAHPFYTDNRHPTEHVLVADLNHDGDWDVVTGGYLRKERYNAGHALYFEANLVERNAMADQNWACYP